MESQHNIHPDEVNKFNDMASSWWAPNGPVKPLHLLNPLRMQFIENACSLKNQKMVDIGCGGGLLTEALAQHSAHVMGVDLSEKLLDIAKIHGAQSTTPPQYHLTTAEALALSHPEQFDIVVCFELLEHVPNPKSLVHACSQLAKPGAHLFFSTINRHPKAFLQAICLGEYILNMLPKGTHQYEAFIRPSELANFCRESQLTPQKIQGVKYQPFSSTFAFSQKTDVNYLMHCTKDIS